MVLKVRKRDEESFPSSLVTTLTYLQMTPTMSPAISDTFLCFDNHLPQLQPG